MLEDIKCVLRNIRFCVENIDSRLSRVESFLVTESALGDLTDSPGDHTNPS